VELVIQSIRAVFVNANSMIKGNAIADAINNPSTIDTLLNQLKVDFTIVSSPMLCLYPKRLDLSNPFCRATCYSCRYC
jgi:hypothetical protein